MSGRDELDEAVALANSGSSSRTRDSPAGAAASGAMSRSDARAEGSAPSPRSARPSPGQRGGGRADAADPADDAARSPGARGSTEGAGAGSGERLVPRPVTDDPRPAEELAQPSAPSGSCGGPGPTESTGPTPSAGPSESAGPTESAGAADAGGAARVPDAAGSAAADADEGRARRRCDTASGERQAGPRAASDPTAGPGDAAGEPPAGSVAPPSTGPVVSAPGSCREAESVALPDASWPDARALAAEAGGAGTAVAVPLGGALGRALAEPLTARTDLPPFDTSAMDGWAVAGPGPWDLTDPHGTAACDNRGTGEGGGDRGAAAHEADAARASGKSGESGASACSGEPEWEPPPSSGAGAPEGGGFADAMDLADSVAARRSGRPGGPAGADAPATERSGESEASGSPDAPAAPGLLAGDGRAVRPLADGEAVPIATGARVPGGATAVLRSEYGQVNGRRLRMVNVTRHTAEPASPSGPSAGSASGGPPVDSAAPTEVFTTGPSGRGGAGPSGRDARPGAPGSSGAAPPASPQPGTDIRPRGQECGAGDQLLSSGVRVTPVVLGMAAAAGYDELSVVRRPRVEVLVLGDELLHSGPPRHGRIRDALGPMVGPWLEGLGAEVTATRRLGDDAEALYEALATSTADLVVTTGGTASGPVDHLHPTLRRLGAQLLVDGVRVRPGHPMLLAVLPPSDPSQPSQLSQPPSRHGSREPTPSHTGSGTGPARAGVDDAWERFGRWPWESAAQAADEAGDSPRPGTAGQRGARAGDLPGAATARTAVGARLVGLPGNPLAALCGLATLVAPLLRGLSGRVPEPGTHAVLERDAPGHPRDTRLVPVVRTSASGASPLGFSGPAMLRGVAGADAFAVVPPGGAVEGTRVELLEFPW